MNRSARDFDNSAICDHLTFHLFDRSPHAWGKVDRSAAKDAEFVKRASFALLRRPGAARQERRRRAQFLDRLPLIAAAATDPRNFVKKGACWALRSIGSRNVVLHKAALALAEPLATSKDAVGTLGRKGRVARLVASADRRARCGRSRRQQRPVPHARRVADRAQRPPVTSMNVPVV